MSGVINYNLKKKIYIYFIRKEMKFNFMLNQHFTDSNYCYFAESANQLKLGLCIGTHHNNVLLIRIHKDDHRLGCSNKEDSFHRQNVIKITKPNH